MTGTRIIICSPQGVVIRKGGRMEVMIPDELPGSAEPQIVRLEVRIPRPHLTVSVSVAVFTLVLAFFGLVGLLLALGIGCLGLLCTQTGSHLIGALFPFFASAFEGTDFTGIDAGTVIYWLTFGLMTLIEMESEGEEEGGQPRSRFSVFSFIKTCFFIWFYIYGATALYHQVAERFRGLSKKKSPPSGIAADSQPTRLELEPLPESHEPPPDSQAGGEPGTPASTAPFSL